MVKKGSEEEFPFCKYENDIRVGYGPEEINIYKWDDLEYKLEIENYTKDKDVGLCGSGAIITLRQENKEFIIRINIDNIKENDTRIVVGTINGDTGEMVLTEKVKQFYGIKKV